MSVRDLREPEKLILRELQQDVLNETGWIRYAVRGWRHPGEVSHLVQDSLAFETIVGLNRGGLVTAARIHVARKQVLYRISAAGAQQLAPGTPFVRPHRAPGRETFFLRYREWRALLAYRDALLDLSIPLRHGGRGWLTARELRVRVDGDSCASYATESLARIGLLEQRRAPGEPLYSRISPAGMRLRIVDRQWVGADGLDQVEVGDLMNLHGIPVLEG